jgi:NAD(P)H-dependent FMN reductase
MNILIIYGSLYEKSINKHLAESLVSLAPKDMSIELSGIGDLPLYDQDLEEKSFPEVAAQFNAKIASSDGVIIVTPEYNRTMPGALKNAIDWSSRPEGKMPWPGKPAAVTGTSTGPRGASFAQYDVRKILGYFDAHVMGQPEVYVGNGDKIFDENGILTDEKTKERLQNFLEKFRSHVELFRKG